MFAGVVNACALFCVAFVEGGAVGSFWDVYFEFWSAISGVWVTAWQRPRCACHTLPTTVRLVERLLLRGFCLCCYLTAWDER